MDSHPVLDAFDEWGKGLDLAKHAMAGRRLALAVETFLEDEIGGPFDARASLEERLAEYKRTVTDGPA